MKYRAILHVNALLLIFLSLAMGTAAAIGHIMLDPDDVSLYFACCATFTFIVGYTLKVLTQRKLGEMNFGTNTRDGFAAVAIAWIIAIIFSSLPFIFCARLQVADALFEASSGLTTTGGSVITDHLHLNSFVKPWEGNELGDIVRHLTRHKAEDLPLPCSLLLWRSLLNWLGGVGIVFFVLLILPILNIGRNAQLYNAEVPGLKTDGDQLTPRIGQSVWLVTIIYVLLTAIATGLYKYLGMSIFDACCHALSTVSTGGFSPKRASIGFYDSPTLQWTIIILMFFSACNFSLVIKSIIRRRFCFAADEEFRFFTLMILLSVAAMTTMIYFSCPSFISTTGEKSYLEQQLEPYIRVIAFQVVSLISTTGFITSDYETWNSPLTVMILFILVFPCGCGGSTSGGMKCSRLLVVIKHLLHEIKHCVYPHTLPVLRLSGERIDQSLVAKTLAFAVLYIVIFLGVAITLTVTEYRHPKPKVIDYQSPALGIPAQHEKIVDPTSVSGLKDLPELPAPSPHTEHYCISLKTAFGASIACLSNIGPGMGRCGAVGSYAWMRPVSKIILVLTMITGRLEIYTILVLFLPAFWKK